MLHYLAEANFSIPVGWALAGLASLCAAVAGMGKLIFTMCMYRIRALEKDVARLSRGCGVINCHWRDTPAPDPDDDTQFHFPPPRKLHP
jgi:hypothetical protein